MADDRIIIDGEVSLNAAADGDASLILTADGQAGVFTQIRPPLQSKSATPTEEEQIIEPDHGVYGMSAVTVGAIPSDYVGTGVPRESGKTVTPTESQQTAVAAYKYTTGAVKVAGIPGDYVGSQVDRVTEKDIGIKGKTVIIPGGYVEDKGIEVSVEEGKADVGNLSITANPSLSVSSGGLVSGSVSASGTATANVTEGWIDKIGSGTVTVSGSNTLQLPTEAGRIITPSAAQQTAILSGRFATGDILVDPPSDPYYDMSGSLAWLGKDATLVYEITPITIALEDTDFNTWTPSTTAQVVLASQTAGSYTATDMGTGNYNYLHLWEMDMPIKYTEGSTPTNKALPLLSAGRLVQVVFRRPSSWANVQAENYNNTVTGQVTLQSFLRYYGSTTGTKTYTWAASYGFYYTQTGSTVGSATANSPTITLKTPTMTARCSTTYMSTANAALIDKENTKLTIKCKVYRVRADMYLQGFYRWVVDYVKDFE